ncbi:MAG: glycosyltransferase family 39 protein [Bacteroidetes bacterium]|nr:glycosyltransferase family 39 protein [Bacteroidota bacterium]
MIMINLIRKYPWLLIIAAIMLLAPALLINLGLNPVFLASDEAIRALVSTEMILSGDYLIPTIQGELYMNKPPLYNWILAGAFLLFDSYDEWVIRLPNLVSFILFGIVIFFSFRKSTGNYRSALIALMFMTSGRLLFWDSFLGLIDILFSLIVFLNFMVIYHFFRKDKLLTLFLISYLLTAVAFMFKALPALLFQAITLLVLFTMNRQFRKLISWKHISGILLLAILLGSYYLIYYLLRPDDIDKMFYTIFEQSTRRTGLKFGLLKTIEHFFAFPFEVIYHFAPWTLMLPVLFRKNLMGAIRRDNTVLYMTLIFLFNIIIYWISPEVFPRYLFMFIPLLLYVFMYLYELNPHKYAIRIINLIWYLIIVASILIFLALPFTPYFDFVEHKILKALLIAFGLGLLLIIFYMIIPQRIAIVIISLLLIRIGYNWFILPNRAHETQTFKDQALKVADITKGSRLYVYKGSVYQHAISFYLSSRRGEIVRVKSDDFDPDAYYMVYQYLIDDREYINYLDFEIEWNRRALKLVKFTDWPETQ